MAVSTAEISGRPVYGSIGNIWKFGKIRKIKKQRYTIKMLKTDRATDVGGADVYIGIISGSISGNVLVSNESDVINMLIMMRVRYAR